MSGGKSSSTVIGYRYMFGIHMGLGRGPVNEIVTIKVGDRIAWKGSVTSNQRVRIDNPDLFGGEKSEGGVDGQLDVMMGGPTQLASSGLRGMLGNNIPGFRRMVTLFFDGMVSAMNPYPKPWKVRVRRTTAGWDGEVFRPDLAEIIMGGDP